MVGSGMDLKVVSSVGERVGDLVIICEGSDDGKLYNLFGSLLIGKYAEDIVIMAEGVVVEVPDTEGSINGTVVCTEVDGAVGTMVSMSCGVVEAGGGVAETSLASARALFCC
uniref:Uncharacterized protein n=1 Tax=Trieres chinensis TaxID=1514140 RepID=A0A7S2EKD5_TRICV|mmetsp:Transcript_26645/g.54501  ORF Transcript_26645/g.54501 Transcript_26645/m.54501 type:complete len:112 (+) Transcript_26645:95-430(+)